MARRNHHDMTPQIAAIGRERAAGPRTQPKPPTERLDARTIRARGQQAAVWPSRLSRLLILRSRRRINRIEQWIGRRKHVILLFTRGSPFDLAGIYL
jgi:hypothetical protein